MKKLVALVVILAFAGLLGWQIQRRVAARSVAGAGSGRGAGAAVPVEVAPVGKAIMRDAPRFTGSLMARSYFVVAPKTAGRLEKLMVNIGDPLSRGQLIALLDDEEYAQQVEQARAELQVAQANVEEARSALEIEQREHQRMQALRAKSIASESELDASEARYQGQEARHKVALAQVAQKEAALKAAEVRHSYTRINASWEGGADTRVVGERFVDEGAMLRANDPIVSILDLSYLTAVVHVIERDYSKIALGQQVALTTDACPGRTFTGTVVRVAPLLKEESRQARVEVEVPNQEGVLKPGMFVRAEIEFGRVPDATVVPVSALARRNGEQGVFLADLEQKKAHFVAVTPGIVNEDQVQVVSPPISGMVVSVGHHLLEDGSAIAVAAGTATAEGPQGRPAGPRGDGR
jgi:RND family efflux transporter MFP subunit